MPLPGKSHGEKNLVGYRPWGRKELDTTERLYFYTHVYMYMLFLNETNLLFTNLDPEIQNQCVGKALVPPNTTDKILFLASSNP